MNIKRIKEYESVTIQGMINRILADKTLEFSIKPQKMVI